jgi:hypothetical protein
MPSKTSLYALLIKLCCHLIADTKKEKSVRGRIESDVYKSEAYFATQILTLT